MELLKSHQYRIVFDTCKSSRSILVSNIDTLEAIENTIKSFKWNGKDYKVMDRGTNQVYEIQIHSHN